MFRVQGPGLGLCRLIGAFMMKIGQGSSKESIRITI